MDTSIDITRVFTSNLKRELNKRLYGDFDVRICDGDLFVNIQCKGINYGHIIPDIYTLLQLGETASAIALVIGRAYTNYILKIFTKKC